MSKTVATPATGAGSAAPRRWRGPALALLVAVACLGFQLARHRDSFARYHRFFLPGFDAYAYLAMAEHPAFFTVAPWGYRVLTPWLVAALPFRDAVQGFRVATLCALVSAGVLLFVYLRRLGNGEWASLVAVAAFGLSGPVAEAVKNPFLVEPLTFILMLVFLLSLEAGAGTGVLAVLAVLGTLSKELFVAFLPLVYFVRRDQDGHRRALVSAALVASGPLLAAILLRHWWTPQIRQILELRLDAFRQGLAAVLVAWPGWWTTMLLGGLVPLALLGALQREARPYLRRFSFLLVVALGLPFVGPVVGPLSVDNRIATLFLEDVTRRLLYAFPVVLPLALFALDRIVPHRQAPVEPVAWGRRLDRPAAIAVVALVLLPIACTDRYRRLDLRTRRDGPLLLALCRQTVDSARVLEKGERVVLQPVEVQYSVKGSDRIYLQRLYWFLREGWSTETDPTAPEVTLVQSGSVVLPCFRPRDWDVGVVMSAANETPLRLAINGQLLAEVALGSTPREHHLRVPASALVRGDNLMTFSLGKGRPGGARLYGLAVRPLAE